jgi:REP element-mobilizing transposase RayT
MVRGINEQDIFHDDEDRERFITILRKTKQTSQYELYAYCLMDNHVHLLLKEGQDDLSKIMKRIGIAYVYWYNKKYERSGHLFQDRFKSQSIENDRDFLSVLRYIHQNPIKAQNVKEMSEYPWNSYHAYAEEALTNDGLIDNQRALTMFSLQQKQAIDSCIDFMAQPEHEKYLAHNEKKKCTDEEAKCELEKLLQAKSIHKLSQVERSNRDEILRMLRQIDGISIRQIERITGIGRNVVANA